MLERVSFYLINSLQIKKKSNINREKEIVRFKNKKKIIF